MTGQEGRPCGAGQGSGWRGAGLLCSCVLPQGTAASTKNKLPGLITSMETVGAKALEDFADNIKVLSRSLGPPAALGAVGRTARDLPPELLQRAGCPEGLLVSRQYPLPALSFLGGSGARKGDTPAPFFLSRLSSPPASGAP